MSFVNNIKFAGRVASEVVVGSGVAVAKSSKAFADTYAATTRERAMAFVAAELLRSDSPLLARMPA